MKIIIEFNENERSNVLSFLSAGNSGAGVVLESAPVVETQAPEPTLAGFDAQGLPWDERIHSSSKKFTREGNWARRRNVADDVVAQVESELQNAKTVVCLDDGPYFCADVAVEVPTPPAAEAEVEVAVPTPPAATYSQVESLITEQVGLDPTGTFGKLQPVLTKFGLTSLADLQATDAALITTVYDALVGVFNDRATA